MTVFGIIYFASLVALLVAIAAEWRTLEGVTRLEALLVFVWVVVPLLNTVGAGIMAWEWFGNHFRGFWSRPVWQRKTLDRQSFCDRK